MDAFDSMKAMGDFWGRGSEAFFKAGQDAIGAMTKAAGGDMSGFATAGNPDFAAMETAQRAFEQSWASATELSASLARASASQTGSPADQKGSEILGKIFDPKGWFTAVGGMDEGLTRMIEGPRLADMWNVERKFAAVFAAWSALRRRTLEHQTLMLEVWTRAAGRFAQILNQKSEAGEKLESWRDAMPLWIETANEFLIETQRSDAFLSSQREMLKASTDLKLAQQEVATFYSEAFGYPTRAELDDVYKAVTDLRREVRGLKRSRRAGTKQGEPA